MSSISDETLMAYADGELSPGETETLEAQLAEDAELRARVAPFIVTRDHLATAFLHKLSEPIPDRLIAAIRNAPAAQRKRQVQQSASARSELETVLGRVAGSLTSLLFPATGPTLATAFSLGAILLAAVGSGWLLARSPAAPDLVVAEGTELTASQSLAQALETQQSGVPVSVGAGILVTPVQTFLTADKGICREYTVATVSGPDYAGVACKAPVGSWQLAIHVATAKALAADGPYATAGRPSAPAVDALVNSLMSGDALGRDDEQALLRNGWHVARDSGATGQGS
jgi:negative regulator of sigma E activity